MRTEGNYLSNYLTNMIKGGIEHLAYIKYH